MSSKTFLAMWSVVLVAMVISHVTCSLVLLPDTSGANTHYQALNSWCSNMTGQLYRTMKQFEKIGFNKTSQLMSSGITEGQRLAFDRRDLELYSLLFKGIRPNSNYSLDGQTIQNCVTLNKGGIKILATAMKISELYLNGTITSPIHVSSGVVQNLRYRDIAQNMAILKTQFRKLAEIICKTYLASVSVR